MSTFAPREVPFVLDDVSPELGIKNENDTDYNRIKITQKDLGSLSVIGSLTRVEYGKWADRDACLIGFRFQFQKGNSLAYRFSRADIAIEFQARPPKNPGDDPAVLRYGPKYLRSTGTAEQVGWHYTASLSASPGLGPVSIEPGIEIGRSGSYTRQYAAEVESDDWGSRKHRKPNCVKIWMREDDKQEQGIPLELLAAVVVEAGGPFQAKVSIKVDTVFNLIAWPWSKDDPLLLEPGVNFGPSLRSSEPEIDFSTITSEEWRLLVTPDLLVRDRQ
ncbi:hypothetical protein QBC47DRAFT_371074 [Echria macrotheca]|uniref:Uncharacterized protein n=1 Tax=Echria macrotheca TaxID=438768 RepID=A0AAJ0FFF8_9PEZI|nr:hypothetical protein QBC47DRAFT_371074 [Echria macrotheca]